MKGVVWTQRGHDPHVEHHWGRTLVWFVFYSYRLIYLSIHSSGEIWSSTQRSINYTVCVGVLFSFHLKLQQIARSRFFTGVLGCWFLSPNMGPRELRKHLIPGFLDDDSCKFTGSRDHSCLTAVAFIPTTAKHTVGIYQTAVQLVEPIGAPILLMTSIFWYRKSQVQNPQTCKTLSDFYVFLPTVAEVGKLCVWSEKGEQRWTVLLCKAFLTSPGASDHNLPRTGEKTVSAHSSSNTLLGEGIGIQTQACLSPKLKGSLERFKARQWKGQGRAVTAVCAS